MEDRPREPSLQLSQQLCQLAGRVAGKGQQLGPAACTVQVWQGPFGEVYGVCDAHQDEAGIGGLQAGANEARSVGLTRRQLLVLVQQSALGPDCWVSIINLQVHSPSS